MSTSASIPALSNQSANIPLLAIRAANEFDEMARGRMTHSPNAEKLADLISQSFSKASVSEQRFEVKSGTVAVFCYAVEKLPGAPKVVSYPVLLATALDYAEKLQKTGPQSGDQLETMKNFCIALSRAAATYRRSLYEIRPKTIRR